MGTLQTQVLVKYSTQLPPDLIKWAKRYALDYDKKDREVVEEALELLKATKGPGLSPDLPTSTK